MKRRIKAQFENSPAVMFVMQAFGWFMVLLMLGNLVLEVLQ